MRATHNPGNSGDSHFINEQVPASFRQLQGRHIEIGALVFPRMDQIDFTGPFEVLSRLPDASVQVIGTEPGPFRDYLGLLLTPDIALEQAPSVDLLCVPGGPGQQGLMADERLLSYIAAHAAAGRPLFSVCTGALLCGAAGVLRGRRMTTHWSAFELLPMFGAIPVRERVVLDENILSAAGVTAGLDGALQLAAFVRGREVAEGIQLDIQYAPEPPFDAGLPETAPITVLKEAQRRYEPLRNERTATARLVARRLGIAPVEQLTGQT